MKENTKKKEKRDDKTQDESSHQWYGFITKSQGEFPNGDMDGGKKPGKERQDYKKCEVYPDRYS